MTAVSPSEVHTVTQDWRDADAHALEREVCAIQNAIAHNENVEQIAEKDGNDRLAGEMRRVNAFLREERDQKASHAREIRGQ